MKARKILKKVRQCHLGHVEVLEEHGAVVLHVRHDLLLLFQEVVKALRKDRISNDRKHVNAPAPLSPSKETKTLIRENLGVVLSSGSDGPERFRDALLLVTCLR